MLKEALHRSELNSGQITEVVASVDIFAFEKEINDGGWRGPISRHLSYHACGGVAMHQAGRGLMLGSQFTIRQRTKQFPI
eukprot:6200977-Pleurochrysis_carterae.AAC.1